MSKPKDKIPFKVYHYEGIGEEGPVYKRFPRDLMYDLWGAICSRYWIENIEHEEVIERLIQAIRNSSDEILLSFMEEKNPTL